jgi:hypothetical protein
LSRGKLRFFEIFLGVIFWRFSRQPSLFSVSAFFFSAARYFRYFSLLSTGFLPKLRYMGNLDQRLAKVKTGNEDLTFAGEKIGYKLSDFWKWSTSDLLSNATRGRFAEFVVATAMGIDLASYAREEWSEYDLETWEWGKIRIEVKSAAYLQSWDQRNYSKIIFSIRKKGYTSISKDKNDFTRPSDVYIFCLLNHKDKKTVDPLIMDQWSFYVVSTNEINRIFKDKSSVSLKSLEEIAEKITYSQLKEKVIKEAKNQ